jgi:ribonuclease HII
VATVTRRAAKRGKSKQGAAVQPALIAIDCLDTEDALREAGYSLIAGVDEVGRGCWAGPVYAGAVILPASCYVDRSLLGRVTDSKLLSPAVRERLSDEILACAAAASIGWVEAPVVDRLNVVGATRLAMKAALNSLTAGDAAGDGWHGRRLTGAGSGPDYVLIDALRLPDVALPQRAVVRGDRSCLAIAAASIVAKVARDEVMRRKADLDAYAAYDWGANKGYGTRRHMDALLRFGVTSEHRRSFAPVKYFLGVRDHIAGALPAAT